MSVEKVIPRSTHASSREPAPLATDGAILPIKNALTPASHEQPIVLIGKSGRRLTLGALEVVTFESGRSGRKSQMGGVTEHRGCSPLSNCACPDASVPMDACKKINTEPGAHTCAPQCVEEDRLS